MRQQSQQQTIKVKLPTPHQGQRRVLSEARRFNVVCCGRRWGKTLLGTRILLHTALTTGYPVAWFAPTYKMLLEAWREVKERSMPVQARVSESEKRIELARGTIEMWSLDRPNVARGRKYGLVIVDEAAQVKDLRMAWNAIIRPTLADLRGSAWFKSTPRGYDYFRELYQLGQSDHPQWASWRMPTDSNPYIHPEEIAAMRADLPAQIAAQEIGAEFITDGAVFRNVAQLATQEPTEPQQGHSYIIGVDWAGTGQGGDYTAFCVVDATDRAVVYIDRFSGVDYEMQRARLQALIERYNPDMTYAEKNAMGGPQIAALQRSGMPIHGLDTTQASKAQWVNRLALALEQGSITLLNDHNLTSELLSYEATRLPGGAFRYSAPPGQHDDTVMALLLAWQAVYDAGPVLLW